MRHSFVKKIAMLLAGVMVIGSLAGCGKEPVKDVVESTSAASETEESVASETEVAEVVEPTLKDLDWDDVEFRVGWTGSDTQNNAILDVVEVFEENYNNLFVTAEFAGWSQYVSRISTQAAGNQLPDVVMMDYSFFKNYDDGGLLLPLNDYIESGALDLSGVEDSVIASGTLDGDIVAIPLGNNVPCFMYDPAIVAEAGVTISEAPTFEEFTEVAKAIYDKTGSMIYPATSLDLIARQMGSDVYEGGQLAITADQLIEYYNWYYDAIDYGFIPDFHQGVNDAEALANGGYWAYWIWSNNFAANQAIANKPMSLMAMPTVEGAPNATYFKPTLFWSVAASSENPDLAVEFINYYINNKDAWDAVASNYGVPIDADAKAYVGRAMKDVDKQPLEFLAWLGEEGHTSPIFAPTPAAASEANKLLFNDIRDKIGLLEMKREEIPAAVEAAIKAANEILAK